MAKSLLSRLMSATIAVTMAATAFAGVKPLEIADVSPEQKTTIPASGTITIKWNQAVKVTGPDAVVFTSDKDQIEGVTTIADSDGSTTVTTYKDLPAGVYTISNKYVDAYIVPKDAEESEYDTQKAVFTLNEYMVVGNDITPTSLVVKADGDPLPGGNYSSLSSFTAVFEYAGTASIKVDESLAAQACLLNKTNETAATVDIASVSVSRQEGIDNSYALSFNLSSIVDADGVYVLSLPQGFLYSYDFLSAAVSQEFTIGDNDVPAPTEVKVTADPNEGKVSALSSIVLTFDEWDSVGIGSGKASLKVDDAQPIDIPDAATDSSLAGNQVRQALSADGKEFVVAGKYVITFPAGYFLLGAKGVKCPEFSITYDITGAGVEGVSVENVRYDVYTLSGVKVVEAGDATDLGSLPSDVYIVNGKKQLIRR